MVAFEHLGANRLLDRVDRLGVGFLPFLFIPGDDPVDEYADYGFINPRI